MAAPELVDGRDDDGFTPLHLAVIAGNVSLVTFLLASNADVCAVDAEKHSVVHWATVCGETDSLRAVLAAGAPISTPDVHGGYPLHYAAQMCATMQDKDSEVGLVILQTLLGHANIDVGVRDGDGRPPLLWAASAGSAKAMLALIRAGAAVEACDNDGLTALHCAASRGHAECIDTLLTLCGSSVDVIDSNGCTALHYAVTLGHADATALLLAHGANANRQDRKGRTPAHCGCAKGQIETVKMLGMHNANLWLRNARGDLPLHEAAGSGRRDLVKWLLDSKPSYVNARNNDGRCPLHLAAINDNPDMCKILIDHGALINPVLRTSKNIFMTPLDCAMQRGFRSTAKYLQLQGGLPATKLGAATIQVNIHENITVDMSMSSDEEMAKRKKPVRKKKATKKEVGSVNTEVMVSDRNVRVNVAETSPQRAEIKISRNVTPKPAKAKRDTSEPRKKATITTQTSVVDLSPIRINENIKEINTLAQSIEAKAKSICQEVNHIEASCDQQEVEQSKKIVVEAAVHSPPMQYQQYQDIVKSLKEELDTMKEEIRNLKKVEVSAAQVSTNSSDALQELKLILEGRVKEIKETVEDFKSDIKSAIEAGSKGVNDANTVEQELVNMDADIIRTLERKVMELEKAAEKMRTNAEINEDADVIRGLERKVMDLEKAAERIRTEAETFEPIPKNPDPIIEREDLLKQEEISCIEETIPQESGKNQEVDTAIEPEQNTNEDLFGEEVVKQTRDEMLEMAKDFDDALLEESASQDEIKDAEKSFKVLGIPQLDDSTQIDETTAPSEPETDAKAFEVLAPQEELQVTDEKVEETAAFELLTETDISPDQKDETAPDSDDANRKRFLKSEKHHHHPQQLPRDAQVVSSLDDVNSDSSFSSTATKREHKSFTIIQPQTQCIGKAPKTVTSSYKKKKLRSRSEETRKNQENLLRRNKDSTSNVERRAKSNLESRIPRLPELGAKYKTQSETNIAAMEEFSERSEDEIFAGKRKRTKKKAKSRTSKSAGSDYESSNLIDSGFEPSPRSTRIPKWRNISNRGVNMSSVTQTIQGNIRRYHLERKIFQHLLELKRLQIRAGQHNEAMLVKRAIDAYHRTCAATVGGGRYIPKDFTFKSFEMFLYESLRKIQKSAAPEYLRGLPEAALENPLLCTQATNRCMHATHAYTGIPCAAYLPKMDHHTIPKIGYPSTTCKPQGFLPDINKKAVTLELCHGNDKQVISLPTDRLDQNKRYYVTFTVKGESDESPPENWMSEQTKTPSHQHSKSM